MRPHHHHADPRTGRPTPMRPVAGEVVRGTRIAADQAARVPAAPGARASAAHARRRKGAMLGELSAVLATPTLRGLTSQSDHLAAREAGLHPIPSRSDAMANRSKADDRMLPRS